VLFVEALGRAWRSGSASSLLFFAGWPVRDRWYADNRDLVKWGVLLRLADMFQAQRILQLAFYRPREPGEFRRLTIDDKEYDIPDEVVAHFRDLRAAGRLGTKVRVTVFDPPYRDRDAHLRAALALLQAFAQERCIAFLDPDTGLEPRGRASLEHVLATEARAVWDVLKPGDVFALYQHQTGRAGKPWIEPKRQQLAEALGVPAGEVRLARGDGIAQDVAFFYAPRTA
jgi:hypothetical protein